MKITIILLSIYLVSAVLMYVWCKIAYSNKGTFSGQNPSIAEIVFTFVPLVNTLAVIIAYVQTFPIDLDHIDTSKFFKVRK